MAMETSLYGHHRLFLEKEIAGVPSYNNHSERTNDCYACESNNFDSNMVMVLAALLCSLLCALGLSSIVRCALRCSHRFSSNNPSSSSSIQVANPQPDQEIERSVEKKAWISIPETKYESGLNLALTDCPICLGDFTEGDKVRVLPICNHGFHVKCIDKWLLSHPSCPLCRQTLLDQPSTPPSSANSDARELHIRVRIPGMPEILTGR